MNLTCSPRWRCAYRGDGISRLQSSFTGQKHHPLIRLFAAGGQTLGETADVQLQLMAIGIEEIVRGTFATVQLPDRHAGSLKAAAKRAKSASLC